MNGNGVAQKHAAGFDSQRNEVCDVVLPVHGRLPTWLAGTLYRNGPAIFENGERKLRHWFDGMSMLHSFSISAGTVTYANKRLRSRASNSLEAGTIGYSEFATDPCYSLFGRLMSFFRPKLTDNACVSIHRVGDQLAALSETPLPMRFDPKTLDAIGVVDYPNSLAGQITSAHPHYDDHRDESISYLTNVSRRSSYTIYRMVGASSHRQPIATIPTAQPAYMHSFAITQNYVVLVAFPFVVRPLRMLFRGRPFIENFRWEPSRGTVFYVVDRRTGHVQTHTSDAFFAFHHLNAFEQDNALCLDIAAYPDAQIVNALYLESLRNPLTLIPTARLKRCTIMPGVEQVRCEQVGNVSIELPRTNYRAVNGKPYRFAYGVGPDATKEGEFPTRIKKIDLTTVSETIWGQGSVFPGEPIFVASPDAQDEDDGVLLSVVYDAAEHRSFLLVLAASTCEELARAAIPHHIPFGFHGVFMP